MKKNLTELVFILDRSGSMQGLEKDTIGGFNSMLQKQAKVPGDAFVSTILFDDRAEVLHDRVKIQQVRPMTEKEYYVRGCTALLDAIREIYPNDFALRQPEDEKALLPINRLTGSDVLAHDWPDFDALMERWENEAKAFDERAAFARMYE